MLLQNVATLSMLLARAMPMPMPSLVHQRRMLSLQECESQLTAFVDRFLYRK